MKTHPTPAERLLAMLEDEQVCETLPADEVRDDLAALALDPARSIAFAKALAGGAGTPGGELLGAIDLAEDAEEEVARLESADIDAVRAQVPQGTAAAIAAAARRQAGEETGVVALKPRRSAILRWGGPVAGIAASLLLVGIVGMLYLGDGPSRLVPREAYEDAAIRFPEPAEGDVERKEKTLAQPMPNVMKPEAQRSRQAPAAPPPVLSEPAPAEEELAKHDFGAPQQAPAPTDERVPLPSADAADDIGAGTTMAEGFAAETGPADEKPLAGGEVVLAGKAPALSAMLIVDPAQVPVKMQSQVLPENGLKARVTEARRLAGDRPVIALYRLQAGAARMDFAQVPLQAGLTQQMAAPPPLTALMGDDAGNYDFILLPVE